MSTAIEDLQRRLEAAEEELHGIREQMSQLEDSTYGPREAYHRRRLEQMRREKESLRPVLDRAFRDMGIPDDLPRVGAEKLREMMIAEGIRPEECLASREIIRMREEG